MICDKHNEIMKFTRLPGHDFYSEHCSVCLDNKLNAEFVQVKREDLRELRRKSHGAFNRNYLINEFVNKYLDDKLDLDKDN